MFPSGKLLRQFQANELSCGPIAIAVAETTIYHNSHSKRHTHLTNENNYTAHYSALTLHLCLICAAVLRFAIVAIAIKSRRHLVI